MAYRKPNDGVYTTSRQPDPTAYAAICGVSREENALKRKAAFLINVLRYIVRESGFELQGRIELKDKRTGRIFK